MVLVGIRVAIWNCKTVLQVESRGGAPSDDHSSRAKAEIVTAATGRDLPFLVPKVSNKTVTKKWPYQLQVVTNLIQTSDSTIYMRIFSNNLMAARLLDDGGCYIFFR